MTDIVVAVFFGLAIGLAYAWGIHDGRISGRDEAMRKFGVWEDD